MTVSSRFLAILAMTAGFVVPDGAGLRAQPAPEQPAAPSITPAGPDWYPLQPVTDVGPSVIGLDNWLPKPAGAKGPVKIVGDHFELGDGTRVKFFGTNLCYEAICPKQADADYTAARFAKYGVNSVRLHKFIDNPVGNKDDGTQLNPEPLARMDYFTAALAKNGVYFTFSPFFGFHVGPGNKDQLLAYDEIVAAKNPSLGLTYGLINYAEDVQDLVVKLHTNILTHVNPNTGKTYAQDPALMAVEIQNEDDIFWGFMKDLYPKCPTCAKALEARYADWLRAKYGSQEKMKAAWGDALKAEETIDARNVAVQMDPALITGASLTALAGGARVRLLDNAAFLHATQNKYYDKLVRAIRATGFQGAIIGSPWLARPMLPQFYNLKSDAMVGLVDRHNYFDGIDKSMMARPGSGYFDRGLQQVAGHPFSLSEWIHVWPGLYAAEGPAIVATYGLGLQDWDASWEFQSGRAIASGSAIRDMTGSRGNDKYDVWTVDTPANLGQYPALSRMILRGDVKAADVISVRQVSDENLAAGTFDFDERGSQSGPRSDVKQLTSTVPAAALAAGRVLVEFTGDMPAKTTLPDMAKFEKDGVIRSNTGQLTWNTNDKGFFTVDTAGTKAAVGFHTGQPLVCGQVTITPAAQFASIYLTALEPGKTLENCKGALLTALARQCNTGFSYAADGKTVVSKGTAPTLLEPVKATFAVAGRKVAAVNVLNHEGKRVDNPTLIVEGGSFAIDTGRDRTFYYEVVFAE